MRHRKHKFQLGVKREHRTAIVSSLAAALFTHGRIQTTLTKAKALRPFAEKIITYAKKAALSDEAITKLHYRRLAIARVRDGDAVKKLFTERASEFLKRPGGYTRIYKLGTRIGDAAETALIELIPANDEGYKKTKKPLRKTPAKKKAPKTNSAPKPTPTAETAAVAETTSAPTETASAATETASAVTETTSAATETTTPTAT
jgi:large subunit ribosomal protein L17